MIEPLIPYVGRWEIVQMDAWDKSYIDLVETGFIEFRPDGSGEFMFGTVHGWLFYVIETPGGVERLEFSWEGQSDTDPGCGRGWAVLSEDGLDGRIFIHAGDDSMFKARRTSPP